jgi:catalase
MKTLTMTSTAALALALALPAHAQTPAQGFDPQPIVDLMHSFAGKPKHRPSGAKGQCFTGSFEPTAEARALSKAATFTKTSPVVARFSVGGGNQRVADAARGPNRGFSFRIDDAGPGQTEFVMINAPINFARTPAQMLGFLQARAPGADGRPDPEKIKAFTDANPETMNQARYLAAQPITASWVGLAYHGVHAYTLTNAQGTRQVVKFRMVPTGGPTPLTEDEAKAQPPDYLVKDMTDRLASGRPASFDMVAIMSRPGDHFNDVTRAWADEETRPTVKLGTLRIAALEKNETCDNGFFNPTMLADGIAGPTPDIDPMFEVRTPAYAISITNRSN